MIFILFTNNVITNINIFQFYIYLFIHLLFYLKSIKLNRDSATHGCSNHPTTFLCWIFWWSQIPRSDVQPILTDWIDWCIMDFSWESPVGPLMICHKLNQQVRSWTWNTFWINVSVQFWYLWWMKIWSIIDWEIVTIQKLEWWTLS